jgi:outer membrane protein assembly factor BamB/predicted MPP superfamily phosphohydrolase
MFKSSISLKITLYFFTFILIQLNTTAQVIHFAHVTDTHVGSQTGLSDLTKTVDDINRQKDIDFVLLTGDITEFGSDEELLAAKNVISQLKMPWHIVPGNHDSKWSESGNNSFVKIFGAEQFAFEKEGYLFIGTASGPNMRMAPGLVPREQIVFLDSILKHRKNAFQPVIFVNHYPLDESLANWYKVIDLLKSANIQLTLLGHGHTNRVYNFEGIPGVMGRSNLETNKVETGYNLVTIKSDTLYYAERLSSGKNLPVWCKIPVGKKTQDQKQYPRPDYSVNSQYPEVQPLWQIQEKSDIGTGISSAKNFAVYATTSGEIVAINPLNGLKKWGFQTNGKIYSTPAINKDKVICASTDQNIYCLELKSGKLLWKFSTGKPIVASAAIEKNRIYIGSSEGIFRCLDLKKGHVIWQYDSVKNFIECKPLILSNSICFGSWGNTFYALDKTNGKLLWKREKYTNRMLSPAAVWPVAANGKIFLAAPDRHITALDEYSGKEIWDSGKYTCRESIGISKDGKLFYIKNMMEGNVDAFFTYPIEQKLAWECKAELGYEIGPSPIVEHGKYILIPTSTGLIVAINKETHQVAWKHKISNALINAVLPAGKNLLLVSVLDGTVVGLKIP